MDPYYAFAEPEAITSDQVPENAVNIERLGMEIWPSNRRNSKSAQLGYFTREFQWRNQPKKISPNGSKQLKPLLLSQPDEKGSPSVSPFIWDTQEVEKIITDTSKPEGEIPDWMKDAGWKPATGEVHPTNWRG